MVQCEVPITCARACAWEKQDTNTDEHVSEEQCQCSCIPTVISLIHVPSVTVAQIVHERGAPVPTG